MLMDFQRRTIYIEIIKKNINDVANGKVDSKFLPGAWPGGARVQALQDRNSDEIQIQEQGASGRIYCIKRRHPHEFKEEYFITLTLARQIAYAKK